MNELSIIDSGSVSAKECELAEEEEDVFRFVLFALIGGVVALGGMICNAAIAFLFVSRFNYRHSPFFFMGFVAFFDCILDFLYLLIMALPMAAREFEWTSIYLAWLTNARALMLLVQVIKLASVSCLVVASYERYSVAKHWTNSGFDYSLRWILLIGAMGMSVVIKLLNPTWNELNVKHSSLVISSNGTVSTDGLQSLLDTLIVGIPFVTLVFLNLQIVLKIRKQNVQDLRALITQLTLGRNIMEIRRENLRSATRSLLFIITVYIFANSLTLMITIVEFFYPTYYEVQYPQLFRFFVDLSSFFAVFGNTLRPPAHLVSNAELREEMWILICGKKLPSFNTPPKLKGLENLPGQTPWFSALLTRDHGKNVDVVVTEDCREPLFRSRSFVSGLHPLFGRESFRRLSNARVV